ncbi:bifunctional glycosyltransferase family 2/GtrA family protein [Paenibacillus sp. JNUCC31]|uniref:bifunctional glycosyltransferase family 2/GtrA family protein n=1 Tax=Paenibacillus sp. JNUCC-31 TaxID=2777983 RepID=UPI0017816962|nr:bifunctional glycosyltransferase family 2/GtrA family protein [Paenibacillus sp. JNUCC-31]QOS81893.1 bifunctional glycosyltransferase family 2/GtrA family protein [Paenibacillus sp. JNUCC-31]
MITYKIEDGKTIILIPSLEPDERLLAYVGQLREYDLTDIVIVDDGSGEAYQPIFEELRENGCVLLRHTENLGKGAALKTGFQYIGQQFDASSFVVTADSDGQHAPEDVYRLAKETRRHPDALVLGVRDFSEGGIPPKSLLGNRMTSSIFAMLYGKKLSDTQTGLRAFGPGLLAFMQDVRGTRFEYELQMLISCIQSGIPIHTMPIQVIYENGNAGTHFKAIQDSARVMGVLFSNFLRFISSSVASSVVDLGIAWFLIDFLRPILGQQDYLRILLATVIARILSIVVNYVLNRHFVFRKEDSQGSLWRYLSLCGLIILLSSTGVYLFHTIFFVDEKIAKFVCDALLFLLSFQLQRRWVFAARRKQL